ncbi:tRNA 5-carboxymethoxyuridine methyltransferase [bacterium HR11]|nr:tRNA 5-carboxymethoxyuridine methyltransferase [bacterium HR11]
MACPFDALAVAYDAWFTDRPLGRRLRAVVWECLERVFQPGDRVIDLGCGTGEDAVWLARRGIVVTAVDASAAMLAVARRKAEAAGVADRIEFVQMDLNETQDAGCSVSSSHPSLPVPPVGLFAPPPSAHQPTGRPARDDGSPLGPSVPPLWDGVLADFGVLNCIADRRTLAATLARWVRPGGSVVLVPMGPLCLWEVGWHLLHGRVRTAFRRFRSGAPARLKDGGVVRVWYPSPRRLRAEFAPYFRPVQTMGLGVLLPPTDLSHWVERRPRWLARLDRWERRIRRLPLTAWLGDHYLMVFVREVRGP